MRYRRLGATGLEVSVIGLGTWQYSGEWGKTFTWAEVDALIGRAGELGINLIDTAECYGDHLAESLIGRAIAREREQWIVATKFGHRFHPDQVGRAGWDPGTAAQRSLVARGGGHAAGCLAAGIAHRLRRRAAEPWRHGGAVRDARLWEALAEHVRAGRSVIWGSRSTRATASARSARPSWAPG